MDERLGLNYIECEETPEGQVCEFQRVGAGAGELNDTPRRARTAVPGGRHSRPKRRRLPPQSESTCARELVENWPLSALLLRSTYLFCRKR